MLAMATALVRSGSDAALLEPDLGALSDDALVTQTLPLASGFGCKLVASAVLVSFLGTLVFGARIGLPVLALGLLGAWIAQRMRASSEALQRARAAEQEFRRRFGAEPLAQRLPEARAQLERDADLELLGLFRGTVLPHGGLRFLRVEVSAQPKLFVCSSPALADLQRGAQNMLEIVHRELPLSAAQVARLRALVRELSESQAQLTQLASFVKDGFPCEASVLARPLTQESGTIELHASANLSGLPEQLASHPSVRLLELFLDLEAELIADGRLG
jgi:hypothetical protein